LGEEYRLSFTADTYTKLETLHPTSSYDIRCLQAAELFLEIDIQSSGQEMLTENQLSLSRS
jgi:hypothetical protein